MELKWAKKIDCLEKIQTVYLSSPEETRTPDLVINSHPLYQLSYRGMIADKEDITL